MQTTLKLWAIVSYKPENNFLTCHGAQWHRTDMTNACPVVVIPQRPRALAEIKWELSQLPEDLTLTPPPPILYPLWLARAQRAAERQLRKPDTLEYSL